MNLARVYLERMSPTLDLIEMSQELTSGSFDEMFRRNFPEVRRYVYLLSGGNEALAEDVAQQAFIKLWLRRAEYDLSRSNLPLLLKIARNVWIDISRREGVGRIAARESESSRLGSPSPEEDARKRELQRRLAEALDLLPEPIRDVFMLSRYHGITYRQIATLLGVCVKTVEARMTSAFGVLRKALKDLVE